MARTPEGTQLTGRHYQAQVAIRAQALRDYLALFPMWQGDERSFAQLVTATVPLVRAYHGLSASVAAAYYEAFRRVEGAGGEATPRLSDGVDVEALVAGMVTTGRIQAAKGVLAGKSPQVAMQTAMTTSSGTVTRFVLDGGRQTIVRSTTEDREALGYARVTAGKPCSFCAMIASRGPVFSEETVGFDAHDHCSCSGEPHYDGAEWPGRAREFLSLYREVGSDPQAFRRALEAAA